MPRSFALATVLAFTIGFAPEFATAGDEVDYSAPYLTVEDGELVTKYPAKGHQVAAQETEALAIGVDEGVRQNAISGRVWIVVAAISGIAFALLLLRRRGSG